MYINETIINKKMHKNKNIPKLTGYNIYCK